MVYQMVENHLVNQVDYLLVDTAVDVDPTTLFDVSLNSMKIRFVAGSKLTHPLKVTKTATVRFSPAPTFCRRLSPITTPVPGLVSLIKILNGRVADPVLAVTVISPVAAVPTFESATAKAPMPEHAI